MLLIALLAACFPGPAAAPKDPASPDPAAAFDARHAAFLQERGEEGRALVAQLDPAERVLASCTGAFSASEASDLVYALARPGAPRFEIRDASGRLVSSVVMPADGVASVELQCLTPREVAERNAFFAEPGSIVLGDIASGGRAAVCTYDEERPSFSCFALDSARSVWSPAGGWTT